MGTSLYVCGGVWGVSVCVFGFMNRELEWSQEGGSSICEDYEVDGNMYYL